MAISLPARGQRDWDDELNNALTQMDASAEDAKSKASTAVSTANNALNVAQSVQNAVIGTANEATATFVTNEGPTKDALSATFAARDGAFRIVRSNGDGISSGALDWQNNSNAVGYVTHFTAGPNTPASSGLYAAGTDDGNAAGFFVSHKNAGAGNWAVGHGGSSILNYWQGYGGSYLLYGEVYAGNQGANLFAKTGSGWGDGVANGTTTFTSAAANFTAGDVGQQIFQTTARGTVAPFGCIPSGTTITAVVNSTTVTLSQPSTASGTRVPFRVTGRVPASTQPLLVMFDTDGATKRYDFTLGKYTGIVPHEIQSNAAASRSLLVKAAVGQTAEIFTVLKDGNATGALSVNSAGLVLARFGSAFSNAGDTSKHGLQVQNYSTSSASHTLLLTNVAGQTADQIRMVQADNTLQGRFNKDGFYITKKNAAPADADLVAGEMSLWFDQTNGAAKLMVKAKQADGTVRTGSVALA